MTTSTSQTPASSTWSAWEMTVQAAPGELAVIDGANGLGLTRRELLEQAVAWSAGAPAEFRPGETVAFGEPNGPGWLIIFLGLQKLSAAALPLDGSLPLPLRADDATALGAHWLAGPAGDWQRLPSNAPPPAPGDVCVIKTTSGSTGESRPLPVSSANMLADGRNIIATMDIGPADRNLGAIPFGHSYGLGNLVMPLVLQGTSVITTAEMLPEAIAALIHQFGATVFPSVPAVLRALADSAGVDPTRLRTLRRVISAGAPLRPGMAAGFSMRLGLQIQNFYGSTETGGICFDRTADATLTGRSVGTPLEGVEVRLDEAGRVVVRSAAVAGTGEYTLPDLGAWNEHGELVLAGRATPLANIGGRKIAPAEIERILRELPGVDDAWVGIGSRTEAGVSGEDFLLAALETRRPRADILADLAARLPAWQIPRSLWLTEQLPRNPRGKVDRAAVAQRVQDASPEGGLLTPF